MLNFPLFIYLFIYLYLHSYGYILWDMSEWELTVRAAVIFISWFLITVQETVA